MNRARAKGTAAETDVINYLKAQGFIHAERRSQNGSLDKGDVTGIDPSVVIEIKNCKTMDLAGWLHEAMVEANNAQADIYAVVHKKRGTTNVGDWYTTLPTAVFVELLKAWCA
jgi:hypothetical protein